MFYELLVSNVLCKLLAVHLKCYAVISCFVICEVRFVEFSISVLNFFFILQLREECHGTVERSSFFLPAYLESRLSVGESCLQILVLFLHHQHLLLLQFEYRPTPSVEIKEIRKFIWEETVKLFEIFKSLEYLFASSLDVGHLSNFAELWL